MHAHKDLEQRGAQRSADRAPKTTPARAGGRDATSILALQRRIGNAAVNRMLAEGEDERTRQEVPSAVSGAVSVQRDLQDHLTDAHWGRQAAGKPSVPIPRKSSAERKGGEILGGVGPALLKRLNDMTAGKTPEQLEEMGRLELFRAMPLQEAAEIVEWWGGPDAVPAAKLAVMENWLTANKDQTGVEKEFNNTFAETKKTAPAGKKPRDGILPVNNHLGDEEQARTYLKEDKDKVLMKFVLKPGAHELLFHPDYMAVNGDSRGRTPQHLRDIHKGMPEAKDGEGKLDGYIGLKQEKPRVYEQDKQGRTVLKEGRGDFSLSLGKAKWSRLLFQLFVEDIQKV